MPGPALTLVVAAMGRDTIWILADRRLSWGRQFQPVDDAVKIFGLTTRDGAGYLAYAGLGRTASGMEPSQWMSNTFRGRGIRYDDAMQLLATTAVRELPPHLAGLPTGRHTVLGPAFVDGLGGWIYGIDHDFNFATGTGSYQVARLALSDAPGAAPQRVYAIGSGVRALDRLSPNWRRGLLNAIRDNERGRVGDANVADRLARLNDISHQGTRDGSVGPRCVVVWSRRSGSKLNMNNGTRAYDRMNLEPDVPSIPTIMLGHDGLAMGKAVVDRFLANPNGEFLTSEEILEALDSVPTDTDDRLR